MDTGNPNPSPLGGPPSQPGPPPSPVRKAWHSIRARVLGGRLLVLPLLVTIWVVYWLYMFLEKWVIDPLALVVLWAVRGGQPDTTLPPWFETYAAPVIGVLAALLLLYGLGFFVKSRVRRAMDWVLQRVPGVSVVYNGIQKVFQTLEKQRIQQQMPQRVVLISFPHPGMKVPAFVTGTCRDVATGKVLVCVYVPTTPVPTSGYFLLVPEEEVTELNWTPEQALQTIISGGLTAPHDVSYYRAASGAEILPTSAGPAGGSSPDRQEGSPP